MGEHIKIAMSRTCLLVWFLVFLVSAVGWFVSVILNVVTYGQLRIVSNMLGSIAFVSLPSVILCAIFSRKKKQ
ncbi:MAG: hypothetical protein A2676_00590 [Candidatus Sungbacteria bacterium RIFCSPHIGHO2_01_FULL_51_22]|nr:MAG: hypothetical protein A2676_00590 [Candidatus Sungbacteria bacterium RIFCSPHIGHO2_01_FULL_51_22]OHA08061.1 MAG: hypothetical protein A3B29_03885 [Candidatus Sungbacteria bacterium RIFCSPLOWO2_01_FULL_51_34]